MNLALPLPAEMPALAEEEFEFFRRAIFKRAGITLTPAKKDLVYGRLRSRAFELGNGDLVAYRRHLENLRADDPEWQVFVNLLTTNKTDWFREPDHFQHMLNHFVPIWRGRKPKIWCAASSTGEEPYSIALALERALGEGGFEIFASDIDTNVLAWAKNGVYQRARLEQVPAEYRSGFALGQDGIEEWMKVKRRIKQHVNFGQVNLLSETPKQKFDLIFCRNVLIYFSRDTIRQVIANLHSAAAPKAGLYIGHTETLQNIQHGWAYESPSIFRKGE